MILASPTAAPEESLTVPPKVAFVYCAQTGASVTSARNTRKRGSFDENTVDLPYSIFSRDFHFALPDWKILHQNHPVWCWFFETWILWYIAAAPMARPASTSGTETPSNGRSAKPGCGCRKTAAARAGHIWYG